MICHLGLFVCTALKQERRIEATFASTRYAEKLNSGMGLVKTRRLAAMQKQQRAKAAMKPPMKGGAGKGVPRQFASAGPKPN